MPTAANLYYFRNQEGNDQDIPVVLIHGSGGNRLHWPTQIRRLPSARVFALDLPGHGKSTGIGQQSIEAYAQIILDWMEAISLFRAVFIGHSMGGAIGMHLGIEHRERVLGLVLIGSGARLRVSPALLEGTSSPRSFPTAINTIISWSFSPDTQPGLTELAARRLAETRPTVLHGDFLACDTFDVITSLDKIKTATLVICGAEDKLTPPRYSQYLAKYIPSAALEIIPSAGHMVMLEKPREVAKHVKHFLAQIKYTPGSENL